VRWSEGSWNRSWKAHAYRDTLINNVNVVAQIVSKGTIEGKTYYSTSCNPEVTLDVVDGMRRQESKGKKIAVIAQINQNLPFMYGDAVVEPVSVHSDSRADL
jgi:hypothetical protein